MNTLNLYRWFIWIPHRLLPSLSVLVHLVLLDLAVPFYAMVYYFASRLLFSVRFSWFLPCPFGLAHHGSGLVPTCPPYQPPPPHPLLDGQLVLLPYRLALYPSSVCRARQRWFPNSTMCAVFTACTYMLAFAATHGYTATARARITRPPL